MQGGDSVRFDCHCSFLEIYNEQPRDLLVPSEEVLSIRDGGDIQGPVVLGLSQKPVQNGECMCGHTRSSSLLGLCARPVSASTRRLHQTQQGSSLRRRNVSFAGADYE